MKCQGTYIRHLRTGHEGPETE